MVIPELRDAVSHAVERLTEDTTVTRRLDTKVDDHQTL
jgi:hypothetical protein